MKYALNGLLLVAVFALGYFLGKSQNGSQPPLNANEGHSDEDISLGRAANEEFKNFEQQFDNKELDTLEKFVKDYKAQKEQDIYEALNYRNQTPGWFDNMNDVLEESPEEDEDDVEFDGFDDEMRDDPYPISAAAYNNSRLHYSKVYVRYYASDNTYLDDREDLVEDPDLMFGVNNLNDFVSSKGQSSKYIRNDRYGTDYELLYNDGSYRDEYLAGEGDDI